jgi:phosphoserine phosphatase
MSDSISIGDGANDLMMLEASQNAGGLGIGYQPKPLLEERLINCIRHTDLTSVLYAQGYNATEFIS